jgi:hypothetical protein
VPGAAKMYVLNAEIGSDKKLKSGLEAKDGAIIANAFFHSFVDGRGRKPPDFPNRTSFAVHFCYNYIKNKGLLEAKVPVDAQPAST